MSELDRLSPLLEQLRVRTRLFHAGPLCGVTRLPTVAGQGFLHILRRGEMTVSHPHERIHLDGPSLIFYPRPLEHTFHNALTPESDLACATLEFDGGPTHPLVHALPEVIVLPLDELDSLGAALELLFGEIDHVRCGRHVLADRLFDVVLLQLFRWILDHPDQVDLPAGLLTGLTDRRLAATLIALHNAPGDAWTLASMARQATMSRSAFAARFKQLVGQAPADYLASWRMTVAQGRLRDGAQVKTVAHELGYATPSAFTRAFTQRLGCSPRAWLTARAAS